MRSSKISWLAVGGVLGIGLGVALGPGLRHGTLVWGNSVLGGYGVVNQHTMQLATLRLIIDPPERLKPSTANAREMTRSPSVVAGSVASDDAKGQNAGLAVAANPTKSATSATAERKAGDSSKCFDDLLSLSLGDDVPGAKERLRKTKC
jgi:hypothetical protein